MNQNSEGASEEALPLTAHLLCSAYIAGVFPMARARGSREILWMDPRERCILPLEHFSLSRRDARALRAAQFQLSVNEDFHAVIASCAARKETWISRDLEAVYVELHETGIAHSVEVRLQGQAELAGGLYGVALGGAFFGESMFSRVSHASKAALQFLIERLRAQGYRLLDVQFSTAHLASLGARSIPRADYHRLLGDALKQQCRFAPLKSERAEPHGQGEL